MKNSKHGVLRGAVCLMLIFAVIFSLSACGKKEEKKVKIKQFGSGENNFYAVIIYGGKKTVYEVFTDSVTVGEGMAENELIEMAELSDGGKYLSVVDGKKVDYEKDKKYWTVSMGGEYLSSDPYNVSIQCAENYVFEVATAPQY